MTGVSESDQRRAIVLQCDQSNWIGPGVGHGRNTKQPTRKCCHSSRPVQQLYSKCGKIQNTMVKVSDIDKDIIPARSGMRVAVEGCASVCNDGNIGKDHGPPAEGTLHSRVILAGPIIKKFNPAHTRIIQLRMHYG